MPSPYQLDLTAAQINTALNNAHDSGNPPASGSGKLVNSDQIHEFVTNQVAAANALKTGLVYSGATESLDATNSYQDLDLSSIVGANRALVYLEVWGSESTSFTFMRFREKGSPTQNGFGASAVYVGSNNQGGFLICPTNASGVVEYLSENAINGVNYRVVAYEVMRTL